MKRHYRILLGALAVLVGCTARYVADYDPALERGAVQMQAKFDELFDDLHREAGTPDGEYDRYQSRYADLRGNIAQLQSQAALQKRNELTHTALQLLDDNLHELEVIHLDGLTAAQVPVLRKPFDTQLQMLVQFETAKKREAVTDPVAEVKP